MEVPTPVHQWYGQVKFQHKIRESVLHHLLERVFRKKFSSEKVNQVESVTQTKRQYMRWKKSSEKMIFRWGDRMSEKTNGNKNVPLIWRQSVWQEQSSRTIPFRHGDRLSEKLIRVKQSPIKGFFAKIWTKKNFIIWTKVIFCTVSVL